MHPFDINQYLRTHTRRACVCLAALLIFPSPAVVQARTFYFSTINGNDANTELQAQSQATPWKSITKLNSIFARLQPGDSLLFKRGDTFYGSIVAVASGAPGRPIVIGAYGHGNNPVITGFSSITRWNGQARSGRYQAFIAEAGSAINLVTINNVAQPMGRYPNANDSNGGYLTYQRFVDTTLIVDSALTGRINWTGAEVVIRKKLWVLDRCRVVNHRDSVITYINPAGSTYGGTDNFGYFFQNDLRTLDQDGEWHYDPDTKVITVYFSNNPVARQVKAATADVLLSINSCKFITVSGLSFEGANQHAVYAVTSDYISIQQCQFTHVGGNAIYLVSVSDVLVDQCNISNALNNGIRMSCGNDSNITVRQCTLKSVGIIDGMGRSGANTYKGMVIECQKNLLVQYNTIDSVGYTALEFSGSNVNISNNVIDHFCSVKDDGGGIYAYVPNTQPPVVYTNRLVQSNIIMNGIGAIKGRSVGGAFVSGIYLDGKAANTIIKDNSIFNVAKNGIHCNNPVNVQVLGNTCFNTLNAFSCMRWSWGSIKDLTVKHNVFYPKYASQRNLYYINAALGEPANDSLQAALKAVGIIDSNYYANWNNTGFAFECYATNGGAPLALSPKSPNGWKAFTSMDAGSAKLVREAPAYILTATTGTNRFANGNFNTGIAGITSFGANVSTRWDNQDKIDGGSLRLEFTAPVANRYVLLHAPIGGIQAGKNYVLRYTTRGTTSYGITRAYFRKTSTPFNNLVPVQVSAFGTSIAQHEYLFTALADEAAASFVIEVEQNSGVTYIDNIEVFEANAALKQIEDVLRIEYNPTRQPITIPLDGNYVGVDAAYYSGSIRLDPFTAKVLVKDTSILRQPLEAKATYLPIKCFGEKTNLTVTATGGIPPYTGTYSGYLAAGTYLYTVKDLRGLQASTTVYLKEPPQLFMKATPAFTVLPEGRFTSVSVAATGGTPPYTGTGTFTNISAGIHNYVVTDAAGCSRTKILNIISTAIGAPPGIQGRSVAAPTIDLEVALYPNPAPEAFTVTATSACPLPLLATVSSITGQVLISLSLVNNQPLKFGDALPAGVYLLKVQQGNELKTIKFMKY